MKYLEKRMYDLSKRKEYIEFIIIALLIALTPIILPLLMTINTQYVVGSIVNTALIITGINIKGYKKIITLITLPSIWAMTSGLILGTASIYTIYMIPFIWIGNFVIIYLYRYLYVHKKINYAVVSLVSVISKSLIIFTGFNFLVLSTKISQSPVLLNTMTMVMGMNQVVTGVIGSMIALTIINLFYNKTEKRLSI